MEENNIAVNLINPTEDMLTGMLATASKPFLVTGDVELSRNMISSLNSVGGIVTVDFNTKDVAGCVSTLEDLNAKFGDTDNLALYLQSTDDMDKAKQDLYLALIKKGWTKEEIEAVAGAGRNSNISRLGR